MIALYRGKSLVSMIIKFRTWSKYSHASWVRNDREFESWQKGGVHCCTFGEYHSKGTKVDFYEVVNPLTKEPLLSEEQIKKLETFFWSKVGCKYDYMGVVGFVFRAHMQGRYSLFCSEYMETGFEDLTIPLLNAPAWKISPGDLSMSPFLKYAYTRVIG